jgi:AraC-like DNA-binding protein
MTYRLSTTDHLVSRRPGTLAWERARLPDTLGIGYVDRLRLADGLTVAISHYRPRHDLLEHSALEYESRALTITLALAGHSSYRSAAGDAIDFRAGHTTVTTTRAMRGVRRYRGGDDVRQLRLIADAAWLQRYALEALCTPHGSNDAGVCVTFHGASGPTLARLADTLLRHHANPAARPLDLQIAALGALDEQSRRMLPPPVALHPDDHPRLLAARDLIHRHLDAPLTIAQLCTAVGTNEFTLKQGFRKLFDTTPHRMLTEARMQQAQALLAQGERVSSVAYRVGFRHPSNFSTAFQRYFGYVPKSAARRNDAPD